MVDYLTLEQAKSDGEQALLPPILQIVARSEVLASPWDVNSEELLRKLSAFFL
jgi:hypothetical protein